MTDRYAVIGNPVAHSKSPWIHAAFARQTRQDLDYGRIEAPLDGFARTLDAFRAAGARGANITLPFKEQAFSYCALETSARARAAAAVNTLRFDGKIVFGDNTDGIGLVTDLERNLGRSIADKRVLLLGAGGAARGVLQPLLERGPAALRLANRTARRAVELAGLFKGVRGGGFGEIAGEAFDLVINATSAGLANQAPALPPGIFAPGAFAYDMVYGRDTPFLALARAAGAAASDGLGMLVEQAAESFLLWRGVRPETAPVLAALRRG
jgi:shikimate dehydrogenase